MRLAVGLACLWSIQICLGQTNPPNQRKPDPRQGPNSLLVETLERDMLFVRPIPEMPVPSFNDPLARADQERAAALYQEYFKSEQSKWKLPEPTSPRYAAEYTAVLTAFSQNINQGLTKYMQERVDAAAAQYGEKDPRYLAVLEDAGVGTMARGPASSAFLERAIQLREAEGPKSVAYWRDLQRKCLSDVIPVPRGLSTCELALEIRLAQPEATPLELASQLQFLASYEPMTGNQEKSFQYQLQAAELYQKGGASPLLTAGLIRRLTLLAVPTGDVERLVRLNDLTNHYLAMGDAKAQSLMLPSETLRSLEEERHAPSPTGGNAASAANLTADQMLDRYAAAERALKTGRVSRPIPFDLTTAGQAVSNMSDAAGVCSRTDKAMGNTEVSIAFMKSQSGLDEKLASTSANALAATSIVQYVCASAAPRDGAPNWEQVPGYARMVYSKGVFTEMAAPRKLTVLPGYGKESTEALEAVQDFRAISATLNPLPADVQKRLDSLPPDAREKAVQDYVKEHPGAMTRPEVTGRVKKMFEPMQKASELIRDADNAEVNPLGFLDLLKPQEAFVDVYKYRAHEGDHFGAEHYVVVISAKDVPGRAVQLGLAEPIDAAINAFLSGCVGGANRGPTAESRGVRVVNANQSDGAEAWKGLQRLIAQPLVAALPKGTKTILLSPDSSLALVPFASLLLDMGVRASVSIVPSAFDFARLRSAPPPAGEKRAVIVGALNYGTGAGNFSRLPGTDSEARKVAELATGAGFHTVTLSASEATRAAILDRIHDTELLHLATHGFWSNDNTATIAEAFRSAGVALSLANAQTPESQLTAEDILHLDLTGVQLVTLSACTSGQGRPVDGQGLLGFQTAFMAAGAHALLLSLWSVPDEATSVLMQNFYKALWATPSISKSEALRQAQEQLRGDPNFSDPRNWAAWVLVGQGW